MKWISLDEQLPPVVETVDVYGRKTEPTILVYYPPRFHDLDFPGHCVDVSNREYVRNGNAAKDWGATHWMELPSPPFEPARVGANRGSGQ